MSKKAEKKIDVWMFESEDNALHLRMGDENHTAADPVPATEAQARRWRAARDLWDDARDEMQEAYDTEMAFRQAEARRKAAAP